MASPRIEHVNITVRDNARATALIAAIFGWHIRWQGPSLSGGNSIHIGSEDDYLALYQPPSAPDDGAFAKGRPLNHVGILVDDIDATEARVIAAGLKPFNHDDYDPGRRFYFYDEDGIEFEVISYR